MGLISDTEYTINISGKQKELYDTEIYNSSFVNESNGSLPSGWTSHPNATGDEPGIRQSTLNPNFKVLAISGSNDAAADIPDFPGSVNYGRWVKYSNASIKGAVTVDFKFTAGTVGANNEFNLDRPEASSGEHLWFQYSTDDTNWNTVSEYQNTDEQYGSVTTQVSENITVPVGKRIYLRWVSSTYNGLTTYDHWAIWNVVIRRNIPAPLRNTFLGVPNLRKQTATKRYHTFLGDQK